MSELKSYSNDQLLQETKRRVETERQATLELLECLAEVEARKLYLDLGYSSLWEYCTQELRLSEGASQRRISAMRLSRTLPEAKEALVEGTLSLSNAAKLQSFFGCEKRSGNEVSLESKQEIVQAVVGLSQSQCEKKLFEFSPIYEAQQKEVLRSISQDQSVLKLVLESKVVEQLNLLRDRLGHVLPGVSYTELIAYLIEDKLKQVERKKGAVQVNAQSQDLSQTKINPIAADSVATPDLAAASTAAVENVSTEHSFSKHRDHSIQKLASNSPQVQPGDGVWSFAVHSRTKVSIHTLRKLWNRSDGKCEFVSPQGRRCCSPFSLEVEHVIPVALGGTNDLENLKYYCRQHNQYAAQKVFGKTIQKYQNKPTRVTK